VLSGTLHIETPEVEFVVGEDEAFVAEPGSPHRAFNPGDADEDVVALGTGSRGRTRRWNTKRARSECGFSVGASVTGGLVRQSLAVGRE